MMHDMMMRDMPMIIIWILFGLLLFGVFALIYFLTRPERAASRPVAEFDLASVNELLPSENGDATRSPGPGAPLHDTIFVLPDISHYTRFMTGNHFSFAHAQHIIFSLINAMIEAATPHLELSKLEGDAALFFTDAERHTPEEVGRIVADILAGFFAEQRRLMASNLCLCKACKNIADLDLKIFVHRGRAARFSFRGSVDHFGTDVIVLHRLMKTNAGGSRYVMVTGAAAESIALPFHSEANEIEDTIDQIGPLTAQVFHVSDNQAETLCRDWTEGRPDALGETVRKLGANARSVRRRLFG